jgi:hypothetical protein
MANSNDKKNNQKPIHTRYIELHKTLFDVNIKTKNLKQIESKISQERYQKFISEYEDVVNQTQPQLDEAKIQLEQVIAEKSDAYKQVVKEMNEKSAKLEETRTLHEAGLIDKNQFDSEAKPLNQRFKELESTHIDMKQEISVLKDALINPLGKSKDEVVATPAPSKPEPPAGVKRATVKEAVIDVPTPTASFFQRFSAFFIISQILFLVLFFITKVIIMSNIPNVILFAYSLILLISLVLMLSYLFFGTRARSFSFLVISVIYFLFGAFLAAKLSFRAVQSDQFFIDLYTNLDYIHVDTFSQIDWMAFWSGWNVYMGALIFILLLVRIFIIGLKADYISTAK